MTEPDAPEGSADETADRELLLRLKEGDDLALNDLMGRWRKPVLGYLYRTVGNFETAADLAQEVFVRVYRSRKRYQPKGSVSSYLFTIAANLARNHFRWRKRHPEASLDEAVTASMDADPDSGDPSIQLERDEHGATVRAAVQRLPEKLRTPVILFHFNELPQSEIATIVGCSEKSVETRLYRARKMLREWL
ncbi:MAG: RNA polymerase sigma factor [Verrucomicrobiae bacterium]|nr:RNA polymerase sigma factor [Verrucomicrobiae bacterium]MCB1231212.1 RNA polymerase sigma factor [Verrucomicrobiae bacterium]